MEAQRKTFGLATGKEGKRKALGVLKTPSDRITLAGIEQNQKAIVLAKASFCKLQNSADHSGGAAIKAARIAGIDNARISEALTVLRYAPPMT